MNETKTSVKHGLISKSNTTMFATLAIAGIVFSFAVVASYTLIKRMNYQSKVINERAAAEKQLKSNIVAVDNLFESYKNFDEAPESVIGTADRNSKIVLDALPSKYDFPALATSLEKLLVGGGIANIGITGLDDEATAEQDSTSPEPVEIPFVISGSGSYASLQQLIANLQLSIRPFKVLKLDLSAGGAEGNMNFTISAVTYYQPEKNLDIPEVEVK